MKFIGVAESLTLYAENGKEVRLTKGQVLGPLPDSAFEELRRHHPGKLLNISPDNLTAELAEALDITMTEILSSIKVIPCGTVPALLRKTRLRYVRGARDPVPYFYRTRWVQPPTPGWRSPRPPGPAPGARRLGRESAGLSAGIHP